MTNFLSSSDLFQSVTSDLSIDARLRNSLINIKEACDEIESEAEKLILKRGFINKNPIFVSSVGNKCEELFNGPTAKSINSNSKKEPIKPEYIKLRSIEFENKYKNQIGELKETGIDPYTISLKNRISYLEKQVKALTKLLMNSPARPVDEILRSISNDSNIDLKKINVDTLKQKKYYDVINKLTNESHLKKFGLKIDDEYIVDSISEDVFLTKIDLEAMRYFLFEHSGS